MFPGKEIAMNVEKENNITLGELATILGGTFLFNYAILLLWLLILLMAPGWLYALNTRWFPITRHEFELVNYCGMAFLKVINIAFFLCPYLTLKLLLRRNR
jgi:hypothetical protein